MDVGWDVAAKDLIPKLGEPIVSKQIIEWCGGVWCSFCLAEMMLAVCK